MATKTTVNKNFNGNFEVAISHKTTDGYELIYPIVEDGVKWETDRQGSPGKLTFKVYDNKSSKLNFQEGDAVALRFQGDKNEWMTVFVGYIFTKKRSKDGWINVTAYDQLRYLKNKATYVYTNKTATQVVKMISDDYKLDKSTIENTNYVISEQIEDDQTLFDIIQNALDQTLISTTKMFVLYADDKGICLRDSENMRLDFVINDSVAEDFEYESSIDSETYNEIELYYDNDNTNKREYYNAIDEKNVANWGRLRLTENIKTRTNVQDRVKKMLEVYNRKTRTLKAKGVFGDYRCRAGAGVIVQLDLGDIKVDNYMQIEKATHTFKKDEYRMDLTLEGFVAEKSNSSVVYSESNVVEEPVDLSTDTKVSSAELVEIRITSSGDSGKYDYTLSYYDENNKQQSITKSNNSRLSIMAKKHRNVRLTINTGSTPFGDKHKVTLMSDNWKHMGESTLGETYKIENLTDKATFSFKWV